MAAHNLGLLSALDTFANPDKSEQEQDAARDFVLDQINNKTLGIHTLVTKLGDYLTHDKADIRKRGTLLLSRAVAYSRDLVLNAKETETLVKFYCDRTKDWDCLLEVSIGLHGITKKQRLSGAQAQMITKALTKVNVQALPQNARYNIFGILINLITKYQQPLLEMEREFVLGYIQVMDGEKDPRCLMSAFWLFKSTLKIFPSSCYKDLAEELFEISSCYFPITFIAPKNDTHGVTGDQLILELRECLSADSCLAPYVMPFLLEKLESDLTDSKIDSLRTISACMKVYDIGLVSIFLKDIWNSLRAEVLHSTEAQVVTDGLETIQTIVACLCPDKIAGFQASHLVQHWEEFMEPFLVQCVRELKVPDAKMARMYGKMLVCAASATGSAYSHVLERVWPSINARFFAEDIQPSQKLALIELVCDLINILKKPFKEIPEEHLLNSYTTQLVEFFTLSLSGGYPEQRAFAITGLSTLCTLPVSEDQSLLSDTQVRIIIQHANAALFNDSDKKVREASLKALVVICKNRPDDILNYTLSVVFEEDVFTERKHSDDDVVMTDEDKPHQTLDSVLQAVSELSIVHPKIFASCLHRLLLTMENKFEGAIHGDPVSLKMLHAVLRCLSKIVTEIAKQQDEDCLKGLQNRGEELVPALISSLVKSALFVGQESETGRLDEECVNLTRTIVHTIARLGDTSHQTRLISEIVALYLQGDLSEVFSGKFQAKRKLCAFSPSAPTSHHQLVEIFTAVLGCHRPELSVPKLTEVQNALVSLITSNCNEETATSASQCLASTLNKCDHGFGGILDKFLGICHDSSQSSKARCRAVLALTWLAKALVIRANKAGTITSELVKLLADPDIELARLTANAYDTILKDCDIVLNRACHAKINFLYRQRFFHQNLPILLKWYEESSEASRPYFLLALSHVLQHIPLPVLRGKLTTVFHLMVRSLSSEVSELRVSTLFTLTKLVTEDITTIENHVNTLIPLLMSLSAFQGNANVRLSSLKCLEAFVNLPYDVIHPYRLQVLHQLKGALDDRKRVVRRRAVVCRSKWIQAKNK